MGRSFERQDWQAHLNRISLDKEAISRRAFRSGMSLRKAAQLAGVSKNSAFRFRQRHGGMEAFRRSGARFKVNRWK